MHRLFVLLAFFFFAACSNNNGRQSASGDSAIQTTATGLPKDPVAREATFNFVDGCMDNFRLALGEAKAYAFCKCIYGQIQAENPAADSVEVEQLALDTARIARMAEKCR